jgi:hypothetical protein
MHAKSSAGEAGIVFSRTVQSARENRTIPEVLLLDEPVRIVITNVSGSIL